MSTADKKGKIDGAKKPSEAPKELSEKELEGVSGGSDFNPQPDPPRQMPKLVQ